MIFHLTALSLVAVTILQRSVTAASVGCLFSEELCKSESQWCFDDGAFGRCIDSYDNTPVQELYRHSLDKDELNLLEQELEKLMESGYRWSHRHTQCVLQTLLFSFQTGANFEKIICDRLKDKDLETALRPAGSHHDTEERRNMAYINYRPSADNPQTDFADEIYYPPYSSQSAGYYERPDEVAEDDENEPFAVVRRSLPDQKWDHFSTLYNTPEHFRSGFEVKDLPISYESPVEKPEGLPYFPIPGQPSYPGQNDYIGTSNDDDNGDDEQDASDEESNVDDLMYIPQDSGLQGNDPSVTGYSEGGVVYLDKGAKNDLGLMTKDDILESLGFKRRERLDVKKPGPPYDPAFQTTSSTGQPETIESTKKTDGQPQTENEFLLRPAKSMPWPKSKAQKKLIEEAEDNDEYDIVDTTYAYIKFNDEISNYRTASHIVNSVAELLNIPRNLFTQERPERDEVIFKVIEPNRQGINASEVARRIDGIKEELRRRHGVVVVSTGIGDKTKLPAVSRLDGRPEHEMYVVTVVVCGVLAVLVLSAGVLYLTRKMSVYGHKLRNMTSNEEPSKHYQELCRARMSGKSSPNNGQDTGSTAPAQRIASLSKESDKESGSSRSSTSSWTEEPALTNMDVATGQMVLSYMEEHLKNKDRLDSEWAALCAYEADPSATTIAQRPENLQKNRYPHALPYDHARVVLNELSNITGSDYINASTITDHDPRNAAYIVTQGPLPHTAPDFWQMVWEQGCVVMVMLTRLGDADASLCHRYWPEEGSELYHIYEVHLVSEHIWCDDYLVRSFYLKNLKTGETRTVTQFHFLSWPEGGVPVSTKPLLEFRRKVNKSFRGRSCPIVVHCSDGVGRSGAYCLLDMVLNRMAKGAKEIDIAATLEHIRDQRAGSVATKQQFQFVLSAVADEVQALLKVLPQQ